MINATNNPYPESPDPSPSKLDKGGYEGNAETLDTKIDAILEEAKVLIDNTLVGSSSLGSIIPSSVPPATGAVHAFATQAGTYTNWGGFVVPVNTFAFISRSADLVFSISKTTLDVTGKVNVSDVINTLTSTETTKPLSAAQGKALNEKNVQIKTWTAIAFASGDQVTYLGKDWTSNAVTVAGDIPGTSSKWVERLSSYLDTNDAANKADLLIGKNLFNKATAKIGYQLGHNNVESVNTSYDYSEFIAVIPGQQYYSEKGMRFTTYFSEVKSFVTGGSSSYSNTFTIPASVFFIKVTIFHTDINTFQLEKGSVATTYEPYYNSIPASQIPDLSLLYRKVSSADPIRLSEMDWAVLGKNMLNSNAVTSGYLVNWITGVLMTSADYVASDFIPILPSTQYVSLACRHYAFYTSSKVYISGSNTTSIAISPSNAAYIRISVSALIGSADNITNAQIEKGSVATFYEKYQYKAAIKAEEVSSKWNGIEANCLGDSITSQNMWQPYIASNLGLSIVSYGIGGTTIAGTSTTSFNNDVRVNALSSTARLVIIMGGTNDWAQDYSLGLENSTYLLDFYGGLNVLIEKLLNKYYTAGVQTQFLFIGTPYGEHYNFAPRGWSNAYTNNAGLTTKDYAEAVRKRCLFYGIPYLDSSHFGWNKINIRDYIKDDGGLLHPNTAGGKRIASVVIGKLKQIEPIT